MDALFVENLILSDDNTWWSTISENNHLIPLPTLPDRLGCPLGALILVPKIVCLTILLFWGQPWSFMEFGCHHHIRKLFLTMAALHNRNHPNHRSSPFRTLQVKLIFWLSNFFFFSSFFFAKVLPKPWKKVLLWVSVHNLCMKMNNFFAKRLILKRTKTVSIS